MNILITGAAGFIGSHLARALIRRGHNVIGIDNFNFYYDRRCKEWNVNLTDLCAKHEPRFPITGESKELNEVSFLLESYDVVDLLKRGSFTFYEGDITNPAFIETVFSLQQFDVVIHLAAMAGVPYSSKMPALYTAVNIDGTSLLLEAVRRHRVAKFVFGSSSSVYGNREREQVDEKDALTPVSVYGATKVAGEMLCRSYALTFGIQTVIIRIFGPIYGPLQRPHGMVQQRLINYAFNNKEFQVYGRNGLDTAKDSTYIDDEVDGFLRAIEYHGPFDVFNIGTAHPHPLRDWISIVQEICGKTIAVRSVDKDETDVIANANITKAQRLLGYAPRFNPREGIRRQIEVFKMMPKWYQELKEV
ncbi:GDP-mannose 4,6-dehydratase [Candidatus Woesearchaeota archaeon]|nr:GDP-mannose 4,6-dehydratase [Candidatus Woesearchaeota archaeon]